MERRLFKLLTESYTSESEIDGKAVPKETENSALQTVEPQIPDLFIYLSGLFNARQFDDFYGVVSKMQMEFDAFMTRINSRAFGQVCKKAADEYKKRIITFDTVKDIVNNEFNKMVFPKHKGGIAIMALALLLGKDRNGIYEVLEKTEISNQIGSGEYFQVDM